MKERQRRQNDERQPVRIDDVGGRACQSRQEFPAAHIGPGAPVASSDVQIQRLKDPDHLAAQNNEDQNLQPPQTVDEVRREVEEDDRFQKVLPDPRFSTLPGHSTKGTDQNGVYNEYGEILARVRAVLFCLRDCRS